MTGRPTQPTVRGHADVPPSASRLLQVLSALGALAIAGLATLHAAPLGSAHAVDTSRGWRARTGENLGWNPEVYPGTELRVYCKKLTHMNSPYGEYYIQDFLVQPEWPDGTLGQVGWAGVTATEMATSHKFVDWRNWFGEPSTWQAVEDC